MGRIHELSPHVADMIAAGEVVERPGSVIKELMENSIDAGASAVTVEIKNGGMAYIRVTDNGCGMAPDDVETAFLRHATSKLRDERGLEAIGTLGFRGEALAAISAVSRVSLMTRERDAAEGTSISLEAGTVTEKSPAGCPEGTTMIVRDLFFNTPARLKFMKTDKAEGANVSAAVLRCALSHPEVSVRYIKDGKEEFHTPGDSRMDSCIYSLLGREFLNGLVKADSQDGDVAVSGYITMPVYSRGNRSHQFFFVNGRYIKSKLLQAALEQAYKNSLFTGRFPGCVLYIDIKPGDVDVNVHPAKTEVKFLNERRVFDGVYYAALAALGGEKKKAEIEISPAAKKAVSAAPANPTQPSKSSGGFKTMDAEKFRAAYSAPRPQPKSQPAPAPKPLAIPKSAPAFAFSDSAGQDSKFTVPVGKKLVTIEKPPEQTVIKPVPVPAETAPKNVPETAPKNAPENVSEPAPETVPDYRMIGEALGTYIIVEIGDSLMLIDKHAAHERMIFDRLKAGEYDPMPQLLLTPAVCRIGQQDTELIMENEAELRELGFDIDRFGDSAVAVRQIPGDVEQGDIQQLLEDMCGKLRTGARADMTLGRDAIMHTVACKAAIKAGKRSEPRELKDLVEKVITRKVKYCPHGRPVAMELTKSMLDRNFKRI